MFNNSQQTIIWHLDDIKSCHRDAKINNEFLRWPQNKYGNEELGSVKCQRGNQHEYLGMKLDYNIKDRVKIDVIPCIDQGCNEFPEKFSGNARSPWKENLFRINLQANKLDIIERQVFHTMVMKLMLLAKRGCLDILPVIYFLSTCVNLSTQEDW